MVYESAEAKQTSFTNSKTAYQYIQGSTFSWKSMKVKNK